MLKVALAEVKTHTRRFIAVGIAVMVAVGFLTATLMVNASSEASLANSVGAGFRNADLVVTPGPEQPLDQAAAKAVAGADGVAETYVQQQAYIAFGAAGSAGFGVLQNLAEAPGLNAAELLEGAWPAAGEVALDQTTAERLQLSPGATLQLAPATGSVAAQSLAAGGHALTVSGITRASADPLMMGQPQFLAPHAVLGQLSSADAPAEFRTIQLDLAPDAGAAEVRESVSAALAAAGFGAATVNTPAEQTKELVASFTGGTDQLTVVLLAFALVALLVCSLVVANTFSVLIAQRTRELALLRCIGADRKQIRGSVLVEALLVGAVSSAAGVLGAVGLLAGLIAWLQQQPDTGFAALAVTPLAVLAGAGTGILMTVLAALAP
ncbi:ABC transporter permease, partial [Arthrobacter crystallopoietes BAB-32]